MPNEHDNIAERQERLEKMVAEFRAAQQRRLEKQGIALWNQAEEARKTPEPPVTTLHVH